jgi:hypothetical protein
MNKENIPEQESGNAHDAVAKEKCETMEEAVTLYTRAVHRLKDINGWTELSKEMKSSFKLFDSSGSPTKREPKVGDYIRNDIPGFSNPKGSDWVKILDISESHDKVLFSIKVTPSPNPQIPDDETAHFYDEQATNTFVIQRDGNTVTAGVHGRNEKPNIHEVDLKSKVRNMFMGVGGMLGSGKIHWENFAKSLLKKERN